MNFARRAGQVQVDPDPHPGRDQDVVLRAATVGTPRYVAPVPRGDGLQHSCPKSPELEFDDSRPQPRCCRDWGRRAICLAAQVTTKCDGGMGYRLHVPGRAASLAKGKGTYYNTVGTCSSGLLQGACTLGGPEISIMPGESSSQPNRRSGHPWLPSGSAAARVG